MLACPSPANPPPSPIALSASHLSLFAQALSLLEQLLAMVQCPVEKQNRSLNVAQETSPPPLQLTRCRQIVTQGGELCGFLLNGASIVIGLQIKQDPVAALLLFTHNIQQELQSIKTQCKTANSRRERQKEGSLERMLEECIKAVQGLSAAVPQAEPVKAVKSQNHSSKRSLLTEKIRKAQREQSQSELILQKIRANPRVYGNIIHQTKVRDRTAPFNACNLDSLLKAEHFIFSEIFSQSQQTLGLQQRGGKTWKSSKTLLTEISVVPQRGRERRSLGEVGCSRCEIY